MTSSHLEKTGADAAITCASCQACCCHLEVILMGDDDPPAAYVETDAWGGQVMARLDDGRCAALDRDTMRRAFTDFEIDGAKTVLGHDLFVAGAFAPGALPAESAVTETDGFRVKLTHGKLRAEGESSLHFAVSRNGRPVPRFDPYVGHRGHLVALRDGDLSYSHVHPEPGAKVGEIVFHSSLPSAGRYRLFLQFKLAGVVHTAPFTVEAGR